MPSSTRESVADPLWYKDAVIYELHVKTFHDSDGDGIGDFRGLIQKLDYLQELGITAIWLLPFYPSPLRDDGYDIADYFDVNPNYGTLDDFRAFLDAAHQRGLRVITELVINHTSDQNPWFQKSRDRKSTRLNSSHSQISYAVFCLKKKKIVSLPLSVVAHRGLPCQSSCPQPRLVLQRHRPARPRLLHGNLCLPGPPLHPSCQAVSP